MAPISLVLLNPVGFILMEVGRDGQHENSAGKCKHVMKNVAGNPIMIMTVLGIVGNFLFSGSLPSLLESFLDTLGSAFSAVALFLLGVRMACGNKANASSNNRTSTVLVMFTLIALKTLVLPIVARESVEVLRAGVTANETAHLADFAFLYGTFPTAPSVFVYAG